MEGGSSGAVIEPGDPDASRLYLLVTHQKRPNMPPRSEKLPEKILETIRKWIEGGALENAGSKPGVKKGAAALALSPTDASSLKPEGPPPMPVSCSLEPVVRTPKPGAVNALAASPWAPLLAVGGQKQVLLYHLESLELLGILPFPEGVPYVLQFSRNGKLLLAGGGHGASSGRIVVFSVESGERIIELGDEFDSVLAADMTSDQSLVGLGGPGKVVRVYSTGDGEVRYQIKKHTDWIYALEFSPDGVLLATADRAGGLFVWEARTGREYLSLRGHTGAITDLAFRADSNLLASGSEDGTIRLWEMENGRQVKRWNGHRGGVLSLRFARDGRLVSSGRDRRVRLWDQNGKEVRAFEAFPDLALQVAVSPDGSRLAGGDWMGDLWVWLAADGKRVGNLTLNPPTIAERLEAARKQLEACSQKLAQLKASSDAARAAVDRSGAELTAVKETVALSLQKRNAALEEARASRDAAGKAGASLNKALAGGETSAGEHSRILEASVLGWVEAQREAEKSLAAAARARGRWSRRSAKRRRRPPRARLPSKKQALPSPPPGLPSRSGLLRKISMPRRKPLHSTQGSSSSWERPQGSPGSPRRSSPRSCSKHRSQRPELVPPTSPPSPTPPG